MNEKVKSLLKSRAKPALSSVKLGFYPEILMTHVTALYCFKGIPPHFTIVLVLGSLLKASKDMGIECFLHSQQCPSQHTGLALLLNRCEVLVRYCGGKVTTL